MPNGMIFWDWNGTLLDDLAWTHSCLNWMLETHGYPQRYDLAAYREIFGFPIEDYYAKAGFDFSRHPYPELAERFMQHYNQGVVACPAAPDAAHTLEVLRRQGWQHTVLSASRRDYLIEQVAAALGTRCVLTTTGHQSRARLEAVCPYVIDHLAQLPDVLEQIF